MELYGSISSISGSMTASVFTGSFKGDGSGLYNIQASGVTGLNLSQIVTGSVSASVSPVGFNVNTDTSITGSLNVSGTVLSQTTPLVSGSSQIQITGTTGYSTFSSSVATTTNNLSTDITNLSSSIATTNLGQNNRLDLIEVKTGSYATTGSNTFKGTQLVSGSILPTDDNAYDLGSPSYQWRDVYISSGSLYVDGSKVLSSTAQELQITTDNGQSIKILEGTTDSIVLQTADGNIELKSSAAGDILLDPTNGKIVLKGTVELLNGNKIQSSVGGTPVVFANDIVVSGSIDITGTIEGIDLTAFSSSLNTRLGTLETSTGSLNSFTSSTNSRLSSIESTTGSLNSYTSSNNTRLGVIETSTSSLNTYTSSTNTRLSSIETTTSSLLSANTTQNGRLDSLETTSGSILSTNTTQNSRLDSIEGKTGSYATTGSNIFQGTQTITGSLYISQDLIVAGSSSIQNISSSIVNIADNIITVNALNPSIRFGGLAVIDSGSSPQVSGSMLFDSVNNQWIFVHQNQSAITSSILMMGPQTFNDIGNESYPTTNRILKSVNAEHLGDSNITDTGAKVSINSNTEVTGTLKVTGEITSAFSSGDEGGQINLATPQTNTTLVGGIAIDVYQNRIRFFEQGGTARGGYFDISSLSAGASTNLMGTAATASYVEYTNVANKPTLVSGSSQITFSGLSSVPSGLISGSSQVVYSGISSIPSGIVSGSSQITFSGISGLPTLVSGSSQISFAGLSNVPGGLVSGSSQIDLTNTTNYASGIKTRLDAVGVISGSAQVSYGSITGVPSGIVSGSSQVSFGSISGVPSGLVSGSSQISFTGTTGYGSIINQAVLTSSSPTFAGLTSTSALSVGYSISSEPFVAAHFYNTNTTAGQQYGGILVSGINQAHVRFQVGTNSWGAGGAKQWQIRVGNGAGEDNFKIYSWTKGADTMTISSNGDTSINGNLTATNLSGTNTGDQTNITGNAGTVTNGVYTNANNTLTGGNKIVIQNSQDGGSSRGIFMWNSSDTNWGIYMATSGAGKALSDGTAPAGLDGRTDHAIRFRVANSSTQIGFLWENSNNTALMQLQPNTGNLYLAGSVTSNGITTITNGTPSGATSSAANAHLRIDSSGNQYIEFRTTASSSGIMQGTLYTDNGRNAFIGFKEYTGGSNYGESVHISITDYSGTDAGSGIYLGASSDNLNGVTTPWFSIRGGTSYFYGNVLPDTNNSRNLGSASVGWANVYTNDLHLSNMNKPEGNDVDGTNGNWTIQEGAENLYIINNNNGKKYKIKLEEI